jgi:single-strand DNA-binding protein
MADLIHATLVGRLTRDAELRDAGGTPVCSFTVAATPYKADAMFISVSVWGRRGESLVEHLPKGQQVVVTGGLSERKWEKDGQERHQLQVRASEVVLVGGRPDRVGLADDESSDGEGLPF